MITGIYDRVIMLKDKVIIADGPQKKVINKKNINNLFDIKIEVEQRKNQWNIYRKIK